MTRIKRTADEELNDILVLIDYPADEEIAFPVIRAYVMWIRGDKLDESELAHLAEAQYFLQHGKRGNR